MVVEKSSLALIVKKNLFEVNFYYFLFYFPFGNVTFRVIPAVGSATSVKIMSICLVPKSARTVVLEVGLTPTGPAVSNYPPK